MKTLVIIFLGLMVHVNQPFSFDNTVVIPDIPHHDPVLRIPEHAVLDEKNSWLERFKDGSEYVIPLRDRKFRVEGTRGVFSDKRPTFFAAAPRLRQLAPECDLRDEVRRREIVPKDLISYITYRGGRLTVESYYDKMLELESGPSPRSRCVACKTRYEADLDSDRAQLVFADGNTIIIAGNSAIEVNNVPRSEQPPSHFHYNYAIFDDGCKGPGCKDPNKCSSDACTNTPLCESKELKKPFFPDADCTNTNYP